MSTNFEKNAIRLTEVNSSKIIPPDNSRDIKLFQENGEIFKIGYNGIIEPLLQKLVIDSKDSENYDVLIEEIKKEILIRFSNNLDDLIKLSSKNLELDLINVKSSLQNLERSKLNISDFENRIKVITDDLLKIVDNVNLDSSRNEFKNRLDNLFYSLDILKRDVNSLQIVPGGDNVHITKENNIYEISVDIPKIAKTIQNFSGTSGFVEAPTNDSKYVRYKKTWVPLIEGDPQLRSEVVSISSDLQNQIFVLDSRFVNITGDTLTGKLTFSRCTSSNASFNIPFGNNLTNPISGDIWYGIDNQYESSGLFFQAGNYTKQIDNDSNTVGPILKISISGNGDGTINVPSSVVYLYSDSNWSGSYKHYHIPANSSLSLPTSSSSTLVYLVANYNNGNPIYQITSNPATINNSNIALVATMSYYGNELHWIPVDWGLATATKLNNRQINIKRFERSSGLMLTVNLDKSIQVTSGIIWYGATSNAVGTVSSSANNVDFWYHSGGIWNKNIVSIFNNTQYDDGTNLQILGSNKYVVNWVYRYIDGDNLPKLAYVLGNQHSNPSSAIAEGIPNIPTILDRTSILIGRIIAQEGTNTPYQVNSAFTYLFEGSVTTEHNNLGGIQGGTLNEYYHLTSSQYSDFIGRNEVKNISGSLISYSNSTSANAFLQSNIFTRQVSASLSTNINGLQTQVNNITSNYTLLSTTSYLTGSLITYSNSTSANSLLQSNTFTRQVSASLASVDNNLQTQVNNITSNYTLLSTTSYLTGSLISYSNSTSANAFLQSNTFTRQVSASLATNINTLQTQVNNITSALNVLLEPTGFEERTSSTISFNDANYTFTFAPTSTNIWMKGKKYTFNTPYTQAINPSISGSHFFYMDTSGNITYSLTPWDFLAPHAQIALVYWDGSKGLLYEERHGSVMDASTHYYLHTTQGTKYLNGLAISNYSTGVDTTGAVAFSVSSGQVADEDLIKSCSGVVSGGPYYLLQRSGVNGIWTITPKNTLPYFTGTDIQYNEFNGSTWKLTDVSNNYYINYYVIAAPVVSPTNANIIIVPGQQQYSTLASAQNETFADILLGTSNGLFTEMVVIGKFTYRTRSIYSPTTAYTAIEQFTKQLGTLISINSSVVNNHNSLSGLQGGQGGEYYHLNTSQYSDFIGRTEVNNISGALLTYSNSTSANALLQANTFTRQVSGNLATNINTLQTQVNNITSNYTLLSTTSYLTGSLITYSNSASANALFQANNNATQYVKKSGDTMFGTLANSNMNSGLNGFTCIDGNASNQIPNNYFDNDVLAFATKTATVTCISGGLTSAELISLFETGIIDNTYVTISTKTFPIIIEVSGLAIGSTSNGRFHPYSIFHGLGGSSINYAYHVDTGTGYVLATSGNVNSNYHISNGQISNSGTVQKVKFTFSDYTTGNYYLRAIGMLSSNNGNRFWTMKKRGDTMFGSLIVNGGGNLGFSGGSGIASISNGRMVLGNNLFSTSLPSNALVVSGGIATYSGVTSPVYNFSGSTGTIKTASHTASTDFIKFTMWNGTTDQEMINMIKSGIVTISGNLYTNGNIDCYSLNIKNTLNNNNSITTGTGTVQFGDTVIVNSSTKKGKMNVNWGLNNYVQFGDESSTNVGIRFSTIHPNANINLQTFQLNTETPFGTMSIQPSAGSLLVGTQTIDRGKLTVIGGSTPTITNANEVVLSNGYVNVGTATILPLSGSIFFGDPLQNGSFRFTVIGGNLFIQKKVAGIYENIHKYT